MHLYRWYGCLCARVYFQEEEDPHMSSVYVYVLERGCLLADVFRDRSRVSVLMSNGRMSVCMHPSVCFW